jgi:hypothetical protein
VSFGVKLHADLSQCDSRRRASQNCSNRTYHQRVIQPQLFSPWMSRLSKPQTLSVFVGEVDSGSL